MENRAKKLINELDQIEKRQKELFEELMNLENETSQEELSILLFTAKMFESIF